MSMYNPSLKANHSHKCPHCGHEWEHSEHSQNRIPSHVCRKCGQIEFFVHEFASLEAEIDFYYAKLQLLIANNKPTVEAVEQSKKYINEIARLEMRRISKNEGERKAT